MSTKKAAEEKKVVRVKLEEPAAPEPTKEEKAVAAVAIPPPAKLTPEEEQALVEANQRAVLREPVVKTIETITENELEDERRAKTADEINAALADDDTLDPTTKKLVKQPTTKKPEAISKPATHENNIPKP